MQDEEEEQDEQEPRFCPDDPALVALNKIATELADYERDAQLRILAAVCAMLGEEEHALAFMRLRGK